MLISTMWFIGKEFKPRSAARKLGLGRKHYGLMGEPGVRRPYPHSWLQIPMSEKEDMERHMAELYRRLDEFMSLIAAERSKCPGLDIHIATGTTVGHQRRFTRSVHLAPDFLAKCAALRIAYEFSAYPCYDEEMRREKVWPVGLGR